uniref:Podocin n=1 Tax=Periophthalmus magnuspinnatus TaxID=409849 RepID=A0A3B4A0Y5_9GOBI
KHCQSRGLSHIFRKTVSGFSCMFFPMFSPDSGTSRRPVPDVLRIIQEYERAVIFRLGRLIKGRVKGPGLFWIIPWLDEIQTVDLRTVCIDIEPQQVLTADSVSLEVDAVLFYRVVEPVLWMTQVHDGPQVIRLLAQTSLRAAVGSHSLSQIITQRRSMAQKIEAIKAASRPWGIQVQRVELKGLALPVDLLRCMALEAETQRHARAKLICAQAELGASLALKQAASSLSPIALQLRYLQSLSSVHSSTSIIVTAVPMEIIRKFMSKNT